MAESLINEIMDALSEVGYPCVWLDATYAKCCNGGCVSSCALMATIGGGADGCHRLLGLDAIGMRSYAG